MTRIRDILRGGLLVLLVAASVPSVGQTVPEESILETPFMKEVGKKGLDHLYNLEFGEAQAAFKQIDARYPGHPIGPFLSSLTLWWEILLDIQDHSRDESFYRAMDEVIRRADRMLDQDPDNVDATFFKGAALGFRGRLKSNRGEWFKAAMDGKKAMNYVLAIPDLDTGNADFAFGKGLYDYFAAIVPQRYPFVKPVMVFFPKGDRELGLQEIQRTADQGYFIRAEAAYFLLQINYLYELDYDGCIKYVTWLRNQYPRNSFFHALEGRVYAKWNDRQEATRVFREIVERYQEGRVGYNAPVAEQALYYLARLRMNDRDYDGALTYLLQLEALSARSSEDTYFKVMGRLRQGMSYDALGRRSLATTRYREVLNMKDHARSHDRAETYLKTPYRG